ncbi:hypothetical protein PIB30_044759 [Stylosanthes scabra]|uniref:Uncharacterized protein n=1 Tax=Stylosanthes scabra TaxID=79078 RepID=A0ABU6QFB8_9FABA|nr:hypothetical protein [Stylosanthes scabra]
MPSHGPRHRAVPSCELTVVSVALGPICNFNRALAWSHTCHRKDCAPARYPGASSRLDELFSVQFAIFGTRPRASTRATARAQNRVIWPPIQGVRWHIGAIARKGNEVASASTPSRNHTTKNSNRGRDDGFPTEHFDSQIHYDRWKTMEHRGITRERIIRFSDREPDLCLNA